ncbi:MAG: RNA polymerase sigma factor [Sandaracinus sp.]|nr:RNA polymerase sigma factor [Myxococcales bacterium]MCB9616473.1 RNA polymerase sigma factor [Sandaracinus sp.]MCB9634657.1 RNA polymerase sigma factor [Sandaracinus sp.]
MPDGSGHEPTERALVDALRRGDRAAFDVAFDRFRPRIFSFLARLGGDRALAEDLTQETFLRLASHAQSLAPDTKLRAWLFAVARNLQRDHRRKRLLDLDRLESLSLWPERRVPVSSPLDLTEADETRRRLEHALLRVPEPMREALLLVVVEGLSNDDAAEVLGLRPDALRQRVSRARALLREALEDSAVKTRKP